MSITAAHRRLYASPRDGVRLRECVSLTHPRFQRSWHLTTEKDGFSADDGEGNTIAFQPGPIDVVPPGQDDSGRGRMPLRIVATPEVCAEIVRATKQAIAPLTMVYRSYATDSVTPGVIIRLEITGVEVDPAAGVVLAEAAMPALDGMAFPRATFRAARWPGLDRA